MGSVETPCPRVTRSRPEHAGWDRKRSSYELIQPSVAIGISPKPQKLLPIALAAKKVVLLKTLAPKRVAGLGGLMECQGCGAVGVDALHIGHRNCLWRSLTPDAACFQQPVPEIAVTPTENTNRIAKRCPGQGEIVLDASCHRPRPMTMEIIMGRAVISPTVRRNSLRASELYETCYCES
jgi:hypothetical protein